MAILKLVFCLILTLASLTLHAQEKVVRVFNWSDYIDQSILTDFEKETGIKVIYDVFDTNELLETRLLAGRSGFDVVVPSGNFMARQIEAGVFMKLDKSQLPNLKHAWPFVTERTARLDPDNAYSVNYMWGTTSFAFNEAKIKERLPDAPTDSWRMIFDPEVVKHFADCGVYLLDTADEGLPAALNYAGLNPNSQSAEDLAKAGEVLKAIRPFIRKFHSSEYINALADGDICLALGYSGDLLQAKNRAVEANNGVDIRFVIPKEGARMWFDQMAIPADAPHPENAHALINFIQRPDMIARASNTVFYANGNEASKEFLNPEVREDPSIYPPAEILEKLFIIDTYPQRFLRSVNRLWDDVKSAR